ncbi:protein YIPF3 isoform X1 [Nilaparvata lugens]|uniref:protein YIPF3 isoform X1 n=1 Tax=Nilaparvata lugens TaxID=108931 RepID=UPI00193CB8E0|nr:protein YIPF3 isoform X1 [Nilaparvata lugens]
MSSKSHSIVFIDTSYEQAAHTANKYSGSGAPSLIRLLVFYCTVRAHDLPLRIFTSFLPPLFGQQSRKVYVDFVGPCLALLTMAGVLHYGHSYKLHSAAPEISPTQVLLYYSVVSPVLCFVLAKVGRASLDFVEVAALLGYGLYGDLLTLVTSLLFDHEQSNLAFFVLMFIFGGLSALRIALVLLTSIPYPAGRLLVCSTVTLMHLMFLMFVHFAYMHRTFAYGGSASSSFSH